MESSTRIAKAINSMTMSEYAQFRNEIAETGDYNKALEKTVSSLWGHTRVMEKISYALTPNATRTVITRSYKTHDGYVTEAPKSLMSAWTDQESYESLRELYVTQGDLEYLYRMLDYVTD